MEATHDPSLDEVIDNLSRLLTEERTALTGLDTAEVEHLSLQKESLVAALSRHTDPLQAKHVQRISELQKQLRYNLVLLIHARDHVRGTIGILTGTELADPPSRMARGSGVRVDLRG